MYLLFKLRSLESDYDVQKLLLQSVLGHVTVDNAHLAEITWWVIWIGKLGGQVQAEVIVPVDFLITQANN